MDLNNPTEVLAALKGDPDLDAAPADALEIASRYAAYIDGLDEAKINCYLMLRLAEKAPETLRTVLLKPDRFKAFRIVARALYVYGCLDTLRAIHNGQVAPPPVREQTPETSAPVAHHPV